MLRFPFKFSKTVCNCNNMLAAIIFAPIHATALTKFPIIFVDFDATDCLVGVFAEVLKIAPFVAFQILHAFLCTEFFFLVDGWRAINDFTVEFDLLDIFLEFVPVVGCRVIAKADVGLFVKNLCIDIDCIVATR